MRRLTPALLVLAVAAGCASDPPENKKPIDPALVTATVEVKGMT